MTSDQGLDDLLRRAFADPPEPSARQALLAAQDSYLRSVVVRSLPSSTPADLDEVLEGVHRRMMSLQGRLKPRTLGEVRAWLSRLAWQCIRDFQGRQRQRQAAEAGEAEFPYEQLLAFYRGQLNPDLRGEIQRRLETDARWRAHYESVRFLDLERLAARQDGQALEGFDPARASPFCRAVAKSEGALFRELLREGQGAVGGLDREELRQHTLGCVYCRRMLRLAQAEVVRQASGLPEGEKLLREWLLEDSYREALDHVTKLLAAEDEEDELKRYQLEDATFFCAAVARTRGAVLQEALTETSGPVEGHTREDWKRHIARCPYCRRTAQSVAVCVTGAAPVPDSALEAVTRQLRRAQGLPADESDVEAGREGTTTVEQKAGGDTKLMAGPAVRQERDS